MNTNDTIREELEKNILIKLKDNPTCLDLKYLAEAYDNIHRSDLMREMIDKPYTMAYGGTSVAQLENVKMD